MTDSTPVDAVIIPQQVQPRRAAPRRRADSIKICFYNHTGQVSGAEKMLFSILSALDPGKYRGVVFAPRSHPFETICSANDLEFHPVTPLNARYTTSPSDLVVYLRSVVQLFKELRRNIVRERPDLVHANTTRAAIVATLATVGTKIPVLWYIHDIMPRHPISSAVRILAVLSGRNRIVAVSRATAAAFIRGVPHWLRSRAPLDVVHNGIDTELFNTNREDGLSFLSEIGLNTTHFRIGIVGQITPRKGHLELIRILAPLFKTVLPQARLLIVGAAMFNNDKAYLELLKLETQRLGLQNEILFLGPRNASAVMKALNVLVLNSSAEPFGLVVTEAMASGTPVVAVAVDGVPEIVQHGISGLLFAPGDSKTLLSHLVALSKDAQLVRRLVREGRKRVEALFDQAIFQSKIKALYERYSNKPFPGGDPLETSLNSF
jgi:glycosyltransferase involved in cell wall biosynthesis